MNKISVIVPVYQAENYLNRCVDSIVNQTYSNIEVILIDDGSKDRSGNICDQYADKDFRVKVIHKENAGVSVARNTGLDIASGDYIAFVDSDDFLELDMYERMMDKVLEYQCDIVLCDCVKDTGEVQIPYTHDIREGYYDYEQLKTEYYPHLLMMENVEYPATISNWVLLFKKALCNDIRYLEGVRFSEDLLFGAQLMLNAHSFYYMKEINLYHYWMNNESITHMFKIDKWNDYCALHSEIECYFGNQTVYDFQHQIDLCLLFFVYNMVGDILHTTKLEKKDKKQKVLEILKAKDVVDMFKRIKILKLPVTWKLKFLTYIYKYHMLCLIIRWRI